MAGHLAGPKPLWHHTDMHPSAPADCWTRFQRHTQSTLPHTRRLIVPTPLLHRPVLVCLHRSLPTSCHRHGWMDFPMGLTTDFPNSTKDSPNITKDFPDLTKDIPICHPPPLSPDTCPLTPVLHFLPCHLCCTPFPPDLSGGCRGAGRGGSATPPRHLHPTTTCGHSTTTGASCSQHRTPAPPSQPTS